MRMVFGLVLLAGVALAGFAVYMVQGYVNAYQDQLARERAARPVAVARNNDPQSAITGPVRSRRGMTGPFCL